MADRRSRRAVALGLSAAVWPGAGQLYVGRRALGLFLAAANFAVLVMLIARVLLGAARHVAQVPDASWTAAAAHGVGQWSVLALFVLLGATWGWGLLDLVLRPPQEDSRDSSHDRSVA